MKEEEEEEEEEEEKQEGKKKKEERKKKPHQKSNKKGMKKQTSTALHVWRRKELNKMGKNKKRNTYQSPSLDWLVELLKQFQAMNQIGMTPHRNKKTTEMECSVRLFAVLIYKKVHI